MLQTISNMEIDQIEDLTKAFTDVSLRTNPSKMNEIERVITTLETTEVTSIVTECLRCLRNFVAGVQSNQDFVASQILATGVLLDNIEKLSKDTREEETVCLRVSLQVVSNLINDNSANQVMLIASGKFTSCFTSLLESVKDEKALRFSAMVIQLLMENQDKISDECSNFSQKMSMFIEPLAVRFTDQDYWPQKCLELLLQSDLYLKYLEPHKRATIVDILPLPPHDSVLHLLVSDFTFLTDIHLLTSNSSQPLSSVLEANSLLSLTSFLVKCSSLLECRSLMQSQKSLVINTTYLLRLVHQSAKTDTNLAVLNKLSDVMDQDSDNELAHSPTFGFKESLIELLTNLVWGHGENKSLVGELEGVAVLLDCSSIDARNPFITQRVVLAIRALTDNHPDNQAVLAGMKKLGAADSSLLAELGLSRDSQGNIRR